MTSRTRALNTKQTFTSVNLFFFKEKSLKGDQCKQSRLIRLLHSFPFHMTYQTTKGATKGVICGCALFRRLLGHHYCIKAVEPLLKDLQECQCSESSNVLRPKSLKIELLQGFQPSLDLT